MSHPPPEITPHILKGKLDSGWKPIFLDVREPPETDISRIEGSILIPLGNLPQRMGELDRHGEYIVYCKVGSRSARAVEFLQSNGFSSVYNLSGGINRWAAEIDTSLPVY